MAGAHDPLTPPRRRGGHALEPAALQVAQRATDRLEELIEDLIEYSTGSREGISLKLQQVDLNNLAKDVYRRSIDKAGQGGVRLKTDFSDEIQPIRADSKRMS